MSFTNVHSLLSSDQTVLIAGGATLEPGLLGVKLVAAIAFVAEDEAVPTAGVADAGFHCGQALDELLELAGLVELPDFLGPTDVPPADENPGQSQLPSSENLLQLRQEARVHRQIPLVDGDAETSQDRLDGAAVLERGADHAEAGEVEDHALLGAGDADRLRRRRRRRLFAEGRGASRPGTEG